MEDRGGRERRRLAFALTALAALAALPLTLLRFRNRELPRAGPPGSLPPMWGGLLPPGKAGLGGEGGGPSDLATVTPLPDPVSARALLARSPEGFGAVGRGEAGAELPLRWEDLLEDPDLWAESPGLQRLMSGLGLRWDPEGPGVQLHRQGRRSPALLAAPLPEDGMSLDGKALARADGNWGEILLRPLHRRLQALRGFPDPRGLRLQRRILLLPRRGAHSAALEFRPLQGAPLTLLPGELLAGSFPWESRAPAPAPGAPIPLQDLLRGPDLASRLPGFTCSARRALLAEPPRNGHPTRVTLLRILLPAGPVSSASAAELARLIQAMDPRPLAAPSPAKQKN